MASSATSSTVRPQAASAVRALPAVSASDLKNRFGEISAQAAQGAISITRHQRPEFVLLPVAQYEALQQAHKAPLDALAAQFDQMVAGMNSPQAKRGVKALFSATPAKLGKAAVKAAKARD